RHGARIHVVMPYSDRLREFSEWYRQLCAESLGKRLGRRGELGNAGPTPVAAVGATDQHSAGQLLREGPYDKAVPLICAGEPAGATDRHSQVQLFMEGPYDKAITFIDAGEPAEDVPIPERSKLPEDLAYLQGHTLGELLSAEREATAAALARMGRMSMTLRLPEISAATFGELLMFYQIATGYAGVWYNVDPFDQPGVELGKRLTFAAMGRPGFSGERLARAPAG